MKGLHEVNWWEKANVEDEEKEKGERRRLKGWRLQNEWNEWKLKRGGRKLENKKKKLRGREDF